MDPIHRWTLPEEPPPETVVRFTYGRGEKGFANSTIAALCSPVMDDVRSDWEMGEINSYLCSAFLVPPVVSPILQPLAIMTVGEVAYHRSYARKKS